MRSWEKSRLTKTRSLARNEAATPLLPRALASGGGETAQESPPPPPFSPDQVRGTRREERPHRLSSSSRSRRLFHVTVNDFVEQRHAVGLGPQPHLSGVAEGRIFDLEELLAVVEHA